MKNIGFLLALCMLVQSCSHTANRYKEKIYGKDGGGIVRRYDSSTHILREEWEFKKLGDSEIENEYHKVFFDNGKLKSIFYEKDNKLDSVGFAFSPAGHRIAILFFKNDTPSRNSYIFFENGHLKGITFESDDSDKGSNIFFDSVGTNNSLFPEFKLYYPSPNLLLGQELWVSNLVPVFRRVNTSVHILIQNKLGGKYYLDTTIIKIGDANYEDGIDLREHCLTDTGRYNYKACLQLTDSLTGILLLKDSSELLLHVWDKPIRFTPDMRGKAY